MKVAPIPVKIPPNPSVAIICFHAWKFPVYRLGLTCLRHLTRSRGVTRECVGPQATF